VLHEYTRQPFPPHPRRSYTHSLGTLPAFTRLATKRHFLPKGKTATHPVEFLHQLNSVSRTTYILTISHGHTRRLPHLLSQKNHYLVIYRSSHSPKSTAQLARHTCFRQANKKKIFSTPPPQSPTQLPTAQTADPPPQQQRNMHTL
jgi:hypothetical protein